MDAKDSFFVFVLLLLSLGLFGSLSLTYCVWNKQTEVASELQNELQELQKRCEIANIQNKLHSKLQSELQNELKSVFQAALATELSKDKVQLERSVTS